MILVCLASLLLLLVSGVICLATLDVLSVESETSNDNLMIHELSYFFRRRRHTEHQYMCSCFKFTRSKQRIRCATSNVVRLSNVLQLSHCFELHHQDYPRRIRANSACTYDLQHVRRAKNAEGIYRVQAVSSDADAHSRSVALLRCVSGLCQSASMLLLSLECPLFSSTAPCSLLYPMQLASSPYT